MPPQPHINHYITSLQVMGLSNLSADKASTTLWAANHWFTRGKRGDGALELMGCLHAEWAELSTDIGGALPDTTCEGAKVGRMQAAAAAAHPPAALPNTSPV